jgi:hypothetical protein
LGHLRILFACCGDVEEDEEHGELPGSGRNIAILQAMSMERRQSFLKVTVAIAVVIGLLLLLAHAGAPSGDVIALVVLVPDAFFGVVEVPSSLRTVSESVAELLPQAPVFDWLFQRPPPSLA